MILFCTTNSALLTVVLVLPCRYGQRVGAFSLVCEDVAEAGKVESQMKLIARPM